MLTLTYFASIRESIGRSQNEIELPDSVANVRELIGYLIKEEPDALSLLSDEEQVLIAVNQTVVDRNYPLSGNEEVAFFPPMTGG
jgi:molybdopterin synthase sulfur carrier subunit